MDADTDVSTLQAILEAETGLSVEQQNIFHNGRPLPRRYVDIVQDSYIHLLHGSGLGNLLCSGTLQAAQVQNSDLLMLSPKHQARAQPQQQPIHQQQQQPQALARNSDGSLQNPHGFLSACLSNPITVTTLPPALRDAVSSGDVERIQEFFRQAHREAEQHQQEAQLIRPGEDPMDPEVQVCDLIANGSFILQRVAALHMQPEAAAHSV